MNQYVYLLLMLVFIEHLAKSYVISIFESKEI